MNGPYARNKKKLFPPNLKFFSVRPGYTKKYFFSLILVIILFIGLFVSYQLVRSKMKGPRAAQKNKQSFHLNLNNFSARPGYAKKYFFPLILVIILFVGLFVPYQLVRSNATAPSAGALTSSFSFTAGGDIGGNISSSTALDLIAQSGSQFDLALGDLSYSEITPESSWCSYVQSRVGGNFA